MKLTLHPAPPALLRSRTTRRCQFYSLAWCFALRQEKRQRKQQRERHNAREWAAQTWCRISWRKLRARSSVPAPWESKLNSARHA